MPIAEGFVKMLKETKPEEIRNKDVEEYLKFENYPENIRKEKIRELRDKIAKLMAYSEIKPIELKQKILDSLQTQSLTVYDPVKKEELKEVLLEVVDIRYKNFDAILKETFNQIKEIKFDIPLKQEIFIGNSVPTLLTENPLFSFKNIQDRIRLESEYYFSPEGENLFENPFEKLNIQKYGENPFEKLNKQQEEVYENTVINVFKYIKLDVLKQLMHVEENVLISDLKLVFGLIAFGSVSGIALNDLTIFIFYVINYLYSRLKK